MPIAARLAASVLLLAAAPAGAQDACLERVRTHADWQARPDTTWSLAREASGGGAIRYFGAVHSTDPDHPQFAAIAAAWDSIRPDRAFFEGPDRGVADTAGETIRAFGESGYVRFLAARDSVPVATLEPDPLAEATHLMERFPEDQVVLFYLLREASRLRERRGMDGPAIEAAIAQLLERARAMGLLSGEITSVAAIDAAYRRYWSEPAEWWRAPTDWFDPLASSAETGGIFTNEVNRASSEFRDRHMARLLSRAVAEGARVFAVVGRNHVPLQAPALVCATGG